MPSPGRSVHQVRAANENLAIDQRERRAGKLIECELMAKVTAQRAAQRKLDRDTERAHIAYLRRERKEQRALYDAIDANPLDYVTSLTDKNGALEEVQGYIDRLDSQLRRAGR